MPTGCSSASTRCSTRRPIAPWWTETATATASETRWTAVPTFRRTRTVSRTKTAARTPTTTRTASRTRATSARIDPEDKDGFQDEDGCPDLDNDQDGIPDTSDKCPNDAEDKDGFEDDDGCPDKDNDRDGIPDSEDLCPNEPETVNGYADTDGCPDEEQVRVVGDKIVLDDRVHFATNNARIRPLSYPLLNRLAKLIREHPEYVHIHIEGHAGRTRRREVQPVVERGARQERPALPGGARRGGRRLSSEGFGAKRPLVDAKTEGAWFLNRRVEFKVTREVHAAPGSRSARSPAIARDATGRERATAAAAASRTGGAGRAGGEGGTAMSYRRAEACFVLLVGAWRSSIRAAPVAASSAAIA